MWQKAFAPESWSNWALVIVGIGAVIAALITLRTIKRQTSATEVAANAAKVSADIARTDIQLFISKERARIGIKLNDLDLLHPFKPTLYVVEYDVLFYGATAAFISDTSVWATDAESPEFDQTKLPIVELPKVIKPNIEVIKCRTWLWLKLEWIDEINRGKRLIHFHGFIRYTDVFMIPRETKFRYLWNPPSSLYGSDTGIWIKCGPEDANSET